MSDPSIYDYPSPLEPYKGQEPLPYEFDTDNKQIRTRPTGVQSSAYSHFPDPITNGDRGGFDIHIYYLQTNEYETQFATELHERIRREFPELRIYKLWHRPIGPHPLAMFEVNVFTPQQFGAFIPWLLIHRGPLSALIHPNTGDDVRDHTQRATWMGQPVPLQIGMLRKFVERRDREAREKAEAEKEGKVNGVGGESGK